VAFIDRYAFSLLWLAGAMRHEADMPQYSLHFRFRV
jgi:hypothetical protein